MLKYSAVASFVLLFTACLGLSGQDLAHIRLDSVNSSYDEHSPMLSPDGKRLYFTRSGHPANIGGVLDRGDIWYSEKTDEGWSGPIHAGEVINHPGLNGVVGFSANGDRIYLLNYFDPDDDGNGKLKNGIAVSRLVNGSWQSPELLRIRYFSNQSAHISATISKNENVLIMAIRSYETEGNEDLYVSFKQADGEWSQPKNLGLAINTYAEEWTPFLSEDERTLYFASNGHGGLGSRDIFSTRRVDDSWTSWTKPVNLGASVNTVGVERSYSISSLGDMAYLSSTQNSEGFGDIVAQTIDLEQPAERDTLSVTEPEPEIPITIEEPQPIMVVMTFQVKDERTEELVDAKVVLKYEGKEVVVNTSEVDSEERKFIVTFQEGTDVEVNIEAKGYLKYQETFKASSSPETGGKDLGDGVESFLLIREEVGTKVEIENVLFNRASATFANPQVATKQIDKLIELMDANPGMAIRLEGHTDNRGDAKLLKELSEERVKAVRRYMISRGISGDRIEFVGFGGEKPLTDNDSTEGREINRRVEFVIIK